MVEKKTESKHEYSFDFLGCLNVPVKFFDFPGGWIDTGSKDFGQVIEIVKQSLVILITINTPYVIFNNGEYVRKTGIDRIKKCIESAMPPENKDKKLILLIPTKCEKWINLPEVMNEKVKKAFAPIIGLTENLGRSDLKERLAIAILPIQTVGNVAFKEFIRDRRGLPYGEYYSKTGDGFAPQNIEQPFIYTMGFLLKQFQKLRRDNMSVLQKFKDIFSKNSDDIDNIIKSFIEPRMKTDNEFEIIKNKEFLMD